MPNQTILEIKDRLNIVDVLSSYIQLKKAGTNYKASCPFHQEKSASLMVSPSKQIWHCFGCNEGGDIITFLMKYENLDFPEALKILADKAGVKLPTYTKENKEQQEYKDVLLKVNDLSARYYHEVLMKSSVAQGARDYLKGRGLSEVTIKEWQIGMAPNDYHALETFLLKKNFNKKELLDAGVSSKSARGDIYDRFFNRVTFPIKNYSGEIVGFTARILDESAKAAKYVNSPETEVYHKSRIIFGLHQAKQQIRKLDSAVVVEGNMDVITCHQAGFKNVVGSSGTAFTMEQLQTLSRLTKNLKFAFDTDQAGEMATKRALDLALQLGFNVYIIKIENAKDPDELIKKDPKAFEAAVQNAPAYMDYFFEKMFKGYNPTSADVNSKKKIAAMLISLIKNLSDPLEVAHYVQKLSGRLVVPEKTIYEILAKDKPVEKKKEKPAPAPLVKSRSYLLEEKIVGYLLLNEAHANKVLEKTEEWDFRTPELHQIYEQVLAQKPITDLKLQKISESSELGKMAAFVVESEYSQKIDQQQFDREFNEILKEFKHNSLKMELNSLVNEIALADQQKNKQKVQELNQKFLQLSSALKESQI